VLKASPVEVPSGLGKGGSMGANDFIDSDWEEIYYALHRKATEIEKGALDDEQGEVNRSGSQTARWAAHLREIMAKIESRSNAGRLPR